MPIKVKWLILEQIFGLTFFNIFYHKFFRLYIYPSPKIDDFVKTFAAQYTHTRTHKITQKKLASISTLV